MDYAPDGSLLQNLQTGHNWTCLELLQLALQTATALQYMHGLRPAIAHLDVKPWTSYLLHQDTHYVHRFATMQPLKRQISMRESQAWRKRIDLKFLQ